MTIMMIVMAIIKMSHESLLIRGQITDLSKHSAGKYCSVYNCCYAVIVRKYTRCLVTASKHVNNIRATARHCSVNGFPRQRIHMLGRGIVGL
jgi:hypothetical protein